jgi:hypothetical protein
MAGLERRLEALEGRIEPPDDPHSEARRKRIREALNTVARLRVQQGVAACDVVPETEDERRACADFEALAELVDDGA